MEPAEVGFEHPFPSSEVYTAFFCQIHSTLPVIGDGQQIEVEHTEDVMCVALIARWCV